MEIDKGRRKLTITIPGRIPPELSPNWQPRGGQGWWHKNSIAQEYQHIVFICACDTRNLWERKHNYQKWIPLKKATLQITIYHLAQQKRMDDGNLISSLKSAIDALIEKGQTNRAAIIEDDSPKHLTILKPKWVKGESKVVLEIERILE